MRIDRLKRNTGAMLLLGFFCLAWELFPANFQDPRGGGPVAWWKFEASPGNEFVDPALDRDTVHGNYGYVDGVVGKGLKFDGFGSYLEHRGFNLDTDSGFTLEAWVALANYPWNSAPILDTSRNDLKGFFFGIGGDGHLELQLASGNMWYKIVSKQRIPLQEWVHVTAVLDMDNEISLYMDGKKVASQEVTGYFIPNRNCTLTMGRNAQTKEWVERQLVTNDTFFYLDGILDEIKVYDRPLDHDELLSHLMDKGKLPKPALSNRAELPKGPKGTGDFGAFHTKLDYYKEWDEQWRVGDKADVFVRFDESPVQLVFWRGASFVPCWVTENDIWYLNEWLETWGEDVASCAEPIMDRKCKYSHVRIIENTDARVIVHWRYALTDAFYDIAGDEDGRGEWCDEYHVIYPDQIGVRQMDLHYTQPERKHDWVEQIVVLPPGKYPKDVIEEKSITLLNMDGESWDYTWTKDMEVDMPKPEGANISFVNLKSNYKPFIVVSDNPVNTVEGQWDHPYFRTYAANMGKGYREDPVPSVYGWWDHWPVAQVPGDGRWVTYPDRPSHFNLTTFVQWEDYKYDSKTRTRIMLQGMTSQGKESTVPIAKSWLNAPKLKIVGNGYDGGTYDESQRAYVIKRVSGGAERLELKLSGTKDSPLFNPAFVIENWDRAKPKLKINGKEIREGKEFRQGLVSSPYGENLVIWLKLDSEKEVDLTFY